MMSDINPRVSALMGLKAALPISLLQISSRIRAEMETFTPACCSSAATASISAVVSPEGSPRMKWPLLLSLISPGAATSAP